MTADPPKNIDPSTLTRLRDRYPDAEVSEFGDSRALCNELIALIRQGKKTATCGALRDYEAEGEALPVVGRHDIVIDWDGRPVLVTKTTETFTCRFDDVSRDFAVSEGEGDFDDWRDGHIRFFERNGGWSPDMMLVCVRFELVEDLG